jgi:hypothetical protein
MDLERAWRLIARARLRGYDPSARAVRLWWWPSARYEVVLCHGKGAPHLVGSKIVVTFEEGACPHVVLHGFVHETGHVQMMMLDISVAAGAAPLLGAAPWWGWVVAFLAWQFGWRELTADLYAASKLGFGNVVRGYTHLGRARPRRRGA